MTRERKRYGKFLCMMLAILVTIVSILGVASQVHAEDASTITIYYDNSDSKWSSVNVHYWGSTSTTWPGVAMTPTSEKADIYQISIPSGTTGVVFNSKDASGKELKSNDVTSLEDKACYKSVAFQNGKYIVLKKNADGSVNGEPANPTEEEKQAKQVNVHVGADYSSVNISFTSIGKIDSEVILTNTKTNEKITAKGGNYFSYLGGKYMHKVVATGLDASTKYNYTIGQGAYTFKGSFTTLPKADEKTNAKFAFLADTQVKTADNAKALGATLNELNQYQDLSFVYIAGDITDNAETTSQWEGIYENSGKFPNASQKLWSDNLLAVAQGNHDKNFDKSALSDYINAPAEGGNLVYSIDDGYLKLITLNLETAKENEAVMAEQKAYLEKEVAAAKKAGQWVVVAFHKSIYTGASHIVDKDVVAARKYWAPVLADLDVDMVLQGHDHVYCRGFINKDGSDAQMTTDAQGSFISQKNVPLYMVGGHAGGLKWYSQKEYEVEEGDPLLPKYEFLDKNSTDDGSDVKKEQVYTIFDVTKDSLTSKTYMLKYDTDKDTITTAPYVYDTFTITKNPVTDISNVAIENIKNEIYTGKAIRPELIITDKEKILSEGTDYIVTYANNKQIGKATATVKGIGNYTGSQTVSFNIVPGKVTVKKISSPDAKKVLVSWEKTDSLTGYEVTYSQNKNFSKKVTKKTTKTSLVLTSLKSKKTYYVKVRAYKNVDKQKVYGSYSKIVKVTVK